MQKKQIRCYTGEALGAQDRLEDVFYTLPDFGDWNHLYSCTNCGTLFVASPEDEHYSGISIQKRIEFLKCPECSSSLAKSLQPYPQIFRASDGNLNRFEPDRAYPPDSESAVIEVWNLYEC